MTIFQAVFLGALQGITEFLPISSSAHLVLIPNILGWSNLASNTSLAVGFDVALHFGSLIALVIYFRKEIAYLITSLKPGRSKKLLMLLIIASIPALIAGLLLENFFVDIFDKPLAVSCLLLVTGIILFLAEKIRWKNHKGAKDLSPLQAFFVGIGQAIAILPGISRSGITISAGLTQGLSREEAARFSFILAIPAIAGAALITVLKGNFTINLPWILGLVVSAVVSYLVIKYFILYLRKRSLLIFAYYCWLAGFLFIVLISLGL